MSNRRDFLNSAVLVAAALPIIESLSPDKFGAFAQANDQLDQSVVNFFTVDQKKPYEAFRAGHALAGGPSYQPAFAYYDGPGSFLAPSQMKTDDLPEKGQVNVSFRVSGFRPSDSSKALFAGAQSGSLRVDVKQTTPLPGLQEALAWTAVAGLLPKQNNPFADLKNLKFDTGTASGTASANSTGERPRFLGMEFLPEAKGKCMGQNYRCGEHRGQSGPLVFPCARFARYRINRAQRCR